MPGRPDGEDAKEPEAAATDSSDQQASKPSAAWEGGEGGPDSPVKARSALSGSSAGRRRTDWKGNPIEKGKKSHQCSFIDQARPGTQVAEVKEVKAFKANSSSGCGCSVM